jgi:hypothetical protein
MGKLYTKSGTGYTPTTSGGMPRKLGSPGQSPTELRCIAHRGMVRSKLPGSRVRSQAVNSGVAKPALKMCTSYS